MDIYNTVGSSGSFSDESSRRDRRWIQAAERSAKEW